MLNYQYQVKAKAINQKQKVNKYTMICKQLCKITY